MAGLRHNRHTRGLVIKEFRRTGRVDLACAAAGVDRSMHYDWLKSNAEYAAKFEEARVEVAGLLEDEAIRRAYHGTARPVAVAGQIVMLTEFSDTLLIFLLKSRNRKVFGDKFEHTGKDGTPLLSLADVDRIIQGAPVEEKT